MATPNPELIGHNYNWTRDEDECHRLQVFQACPQFHGEMFSTKIGMSITQFDRANRVFYASPIQCINAASVKTHNPSLVETDAKKTNSKLCITGEHFNMSDAERTQEMRRVEGFIQYNELRVDGDDGKFKEKVMTRQSGPHQVGTFTLIYLLHRQWINKDTVQTGVTFAYGHGYGLNKMQRLNNDQEIFWEDESFLDLEPIDMFHHATYLSMLELDITSIDDIARKLFGLELKSFERLMELSETS